MKFEKVVPWGSSERIVVATDEEIAWFAIGGLYSMHNALLSEELWLVDYTPEQREALASGDRQALEAVLTPRDGMPGHYLASDHTRRNIAEHSATIHLNSQFGHRTQIVTRSIIEVVPHAHVEEIVALPPQQKPPSSGRRRTTFPGLSPARTEGPDLGPINQLHPSSGS